MIKFEYVPITLSNFTQAELNNLESYCSNIINYSLHNNTNSKCILKLPLNNPIPDCFLSLTRYNETEIKSFLSTSEWQNTYQTLTKKELAAIALTDTSNTPEGVL